MGKQLWLTFYETEKCFNSLWLGDCINSLWDNGVKDETLLLIYKLNVKANIIFLLTGLRIYTGEYKAQGPTLCPTEGRALRGPRALYSLV